MRTRTLTPGPQQPPAEIGLMQFLGLTSTASSTGAWHCFQASAEQRDTILLCLMFLSNMQLSYHRLSQGVPRQKASCWTINKPSTKNICRKKIIMTLLCAAYRQSIWTSANSCPSVITKKLRSEESAKKAATHCSKQIIHSHHPQLFTREIGVLQYNLTNYSLL